ncbi:U3 small nucleolar RNA-associated 17 [Hyphodiscus hymeniophilus]|uniref:U3 small nucleolar RNA-associated 17 n=1 Tax=Hyphodiscus hymeniophilus TaxID=353542 RepID=A0A9P6VR66_9HELO|nr:U3 small nucleolar RNA-associated 17 [Hyphodiscus hymeniophilus]
MASALKKRKRGHGDVISDSERAKLAKVSQVALPTPQLSQVTGWDAAFAPLKDLTNGINGDRSQSQERLASPEVVKFEEYQESMQLEERALEELRLKKQKKSEKHTIEELAKQERKLLKKVLATNDANSWKLSESIGGRQINADPVFTADEKYIILANRTAINVYSTENSLLNRSINLKIESAALFNAHIIAYSLSPTNPSIIWVACSDGSIYSIDWTSGEGADQSWAISSTGCIHMTVASMLSAERRRDVVFTTEIRKDGGWRITANELARPSDSFQTAARTIYTSNQRISFLKTANGGSVIVAASEKRVLVGSLRSTEYNTIDKIRYEFRVFESTDFVSSLDLRVSARKHAENLGKSVLKRLPVVDVVVGDVRGSIFVHDDLLGNLSRSQDNKSAPGISLIPRKLHWHRKEVCAVKWSLDGNYIISGGTETVLVLWQLDTGKKQFLPHMSATIQNVVVSPTGTSYGIQLGDNSTMVLSVTELIPTANIAGIQISVLDSEEVVEAQVRRLTEERDEQAFMQRTPAAISLVDPSRLLIGVGQTQEISPNNPSVSSIPYLQTFDLGSGHNISRQALTRTNETNVNITPSAHKISEPRVILMKMSFDGKWLATVDEWTPPKRDVEFLEHWGKNIDDDRRCRREVYLKFWQWSIDKEKWELVSRIDAPHCLSGRLSGAGKVLDLAADPSSLRFATVGEDGFVRTWSTKRRKRDGVVVREKSGQALRNWDCQHAVPLGKLDLHTDSENTRENPANGCVTFSEDGSLLAAACGMEDIIHLLEPESGTIRLSKSGIFGSGIVKAEFFGQDLITLSDKLLVYDIVSDEVRHSIKLSPSVTKLSVSQKTEMLHLAVDRKSRTFAVALPAGFEWGKSESLLSKCSELAVFEHDNREPILKETFTSLITSLLPAVGSDGYLVLDSAAEIRVVLRTGSQSITTQAQSTSALQLDEVTESNGDLLRLVEDEGEVVNGLLPASQTVNADEDDETPVVTQQQLTKIFDIGPSFALPPMEQLFYQVAGLFISPPLAQKVL